MIPPIISCSPFVAGITGTRKLPKRKGPLENACLITHAIHFVSVVLIVGLKRRSRDGASEFQQSCLHASWWGLCLCAAFLSIVKAMAAQDSKLRTEAIELLERARLLAL